METCGNVESQLLRHGDGVVGRGAGDIGIKGKFYLIISLRQLVKFNGEGNSAQISMQEIALFVLSSSLCLQRINVAFIEDDSRKACIFHTGNRSLPAITNMHRPPMISSPLNVNYALDQFDRTFPSSNMTNKMIYTSANLLTYLSHLRFSHIKRNGDRASMPCSRLTFPHNRTSVVRLLVARYWLHWLPVLGHARSDYLNHTSPCSSTLRDRRKRSLPEPSAPEPNYRRRYPRRARYDPTCREYRHRY